MADQPLVSVRGEAVLEVDPEIATISVVTSAMDKDRGRTLVLLEQRSKAITELLDQHADAIEKTETTALRVHPQLKDNRPRERVVGYVATMRYTITVVDFTVLGDLVVRLAEHEMTDVSGPWWALRNDSLVYRQARLAAARDAMNRARDYAEALGGELDGVVQIADLGLLAEPAPVASYRPAAAPAPASRAAGGEIEPIVLDVEPTRQTVRAHVEARFEMTQPDLRSRGS